MFPGLSESSSGGTLFSSRSADSRIPASWERVFDLGELGVTRWLEEPRVPSAVQAQEPKTKVVPSGTLFALLDLAIEFVGEFAESPTWRASYRCLPPSLLRDTLSSRVCRWGSTIWNSMVHETQRFRQVRAASLRNTLRPVWFVLP